MKGNNRCEKEGNFKISNIFEFDCSPFTRCKPKARKITAVNKREIEETNGTADFSISLSLSSVRLCDCLHTQA